MPSLEFKGKQFVYPHHLGVPFRTLDIDAAKSCPAPGGKSWSVLEVDFIVIE